MNSTFEKFTDRLTEIGNKMAAEKHLAAVTRGMMAIMPLTVFGSIFQLIAALPDIFPFVPAYSEATSAAILLPYNVTFAIFGIVASFAIAYHLASSYKLNQLTSGVTAMLTFFVIAGGYDAAAGTFSTAFLGAAGLFVAIAVGLISVEVTRFLDTHNIKLQFPDSIPPYVATSFNAIISLTVNVLIGYGIELLCEKSAGVCLPALIQQLLAPALTASESIWFTVIVQGLIALLSCLGVHGFNTLAGIILPLAIANTGANAAAFQAGEKATQLFTLSSFQMTGCFYWIIPVMMLACKSERLKTVGKLSLVPAIFNISEPIQFGAPLVFNPLMAIPFILMNMVNAAIVWLSMYLNLCSKTVMMVSANIPMPIFQYLVTLDFRSILVFAVMVVASYLIYKPFMAAYDKNLLAEEAEGK